MADGRRQKAAPRPETRRSGCRVEGAFALRASRAKPRGLCMAHCGRFAARHKGDRTARASVQRAAGDHEEEEEKEGPRATHLNCWRMPDTGAAGVGEGSAFRTR